ncbi:hypothetical protein RHMOL_Rhmol10G0146900 [Rhododendron molle]|uniref:Uncharacterized protein n=1 Tax=Rhododendron molle TaxID=49168 RepID=A0ACC0M297_RHOML|nr:hypothetical protein RHMOL_Rhmol10G0146900 [Rhododendron molle]
MVSTESSSSSEESENIIVYSVDRDPSPSNVASSEDCDPPFADGHPRLRWSGRHCRGANQYGGCVAPEGRGRG